MKGITYNSRRQSNFVNSLNPEQRERYIKDGIARCHPELLIPFIKIVKHDKYFREIEYVIEIPDSEED